MYTLTALQDTFLKKLPASSLELPSSKLKPVKKGDTIIIESGVLREGHLYCELSYGAGDWYIFPPHWTKYEPTSKTLTEEDYKRAAELLKCEIAIIKAVVEVEASGSGFFNNGKPKILYEAHIFSAITKHRYDSIYPKISSRRWNRSLYIGGSAEYNRLEQAMKVDREAAIQSASWGMFQILGLNYKLCGYKKVEDYYQDQFISEAIHLNCFINFIKSNKLDGHLRNREWAKFARGYNGPAFAKNRYDTKLQTAYKKFSK